MAPPRDLRGAWAACPVDYRRRTWALLPCWRISSRAFLPCSTSWWSASPDSRLGLGEVPIACVQLRSGASLTLQEIEALLIRHGVTRRFWPVGLRILTEWLLGPTGKIDRRAVLASVVLREH